MISRSVCVDLDGVLAKYDQWRGVNHIGNPIPGAKKFLKDLKGYNCKIIIFTTRCSSKFNMHLGPVTLRKKVKLWLDDNDMLFDSIWIGQGKPLAAAYVDDRGVSCTPQFDGGGFAIPLMEVRQLIAAEK